jgi:DNA-binding Xre family transcriptional regulator
MAAHQMFKTTDLVPLLHERGIDLSPSQVHRLVTQIPERLSLAILAALCDIFECTATDLVPTAAESAVEKLRETAGGDSNVVDLATTGRPKRARVYRDT